MDTSIEYSKDFRPQHPCLTSLHYPHRCHHHRHHHFHVSPHCPLHSNMILHFNIHSPTCPLFNSDPFSQRENLLPDVHNLRPSESKEAVSETQENVGLVEEEGDEDPVFVLTDEWREFFAKSEARRRQEKKQAKKKKGKK